MSMFRIVTVLVTAMLLNIGGAQASQFSGIYLGAKLGTNISKVTDANGATVISTEKTTAYLMQGGYLQGGYNLDLSAVVVGVGAYYDWNANEKHFQGVQGVRYGSRSKGFDAKLGVPLGGWMPYAKLGYGQNTGTYDLSSISQKGPNSALGIEYKLADHWSTVGEYKLNKFSNQDGSLTIRNKTITLGLNYYFDEPPVKDTYQEPEPQPIPELAPIPEPTGPEPGEPAPVPPPELPSPPPPPLPVPEVWKTLIEEKAVNIEGTNFARGSAKLELKAGEELLKEVVKFVGSHPDAHLELIGYTDSHGAEKLNAKLSLERAKSVKTYLVGAGISADRITVKGAGSSNPVADNNTSEGRAKNRRVEIRSIIKEEKKVLANEAAAVPVPSIVPEPIVAPVPVPVSVAEIISSQEPQKALAKDEPIRIDGSNFMPGSGKLKPGAINSLDEVVKAATDNPQSKLKISGYYVDERSTQEVAEQLSGSRAESIKEYLVSKGVGAERITTVGKGMADPVGDNSTSEGRALNRRVDIHFLE